MNFHGNLFLVRHGETELNKQHIFQGHIDSGLTEKGVEQAHEAGEKLKGRGIDIIISSDLKRAVHTAEIIGKALGLSIEKEIPELRERFWGEMEGRPFEEIKNANPEWVNENGIFILENDFPTAEPVQVFYDRITSTIMALAKEYKEKKILLVVHKGVLNMMYAHVNKVDPKLIRTIYNPDNGAIENY